MNVNQEDIVGITENGRYRARLERDQHPVNPRTDYDHITHVITPRGQRYVDVDEDGGPLQDAWDRVADRDDAVEVFTRYARIFHGVVVVEDRPVDGAWSLWYMTPEQIKEVSTPPEEFISSEIQEYRNWAEGEVYVSVIEERATWARAEVSKAGTMQTWETVESCGDLNGWDCAKSYALEQLSYWGTVLKSG